MFVVGDYWITRVLHTVIVLLSVCIVQIEAKGSVPQYSLYDSKCGRVAIGENDYAGVVTMTSGDLKYTYSETNSCDVVISPKKLRDNATRILFYFTEFSLTGDCEDNNVRIYEGSGSTIKGLDTVLCGHHNKSLEDPLKVFTSTESEIHLVYSWSGDWEYRQSTFNLTFVSFHYGPCPGYLFSCSTFKCISTTISCMDNLNACGNGTEKKCIIYSTIEKIMGSAFRIAQNLFYILCIVTVCLLLRRIYKQKVKEHGTACNIPMLRRLFSRNDNRNNNDTDRGGNREPTFQNSRVRTDIPESERIPLSAYDRDYFNTADFNTEPPPYDAVIEHEQESRRYNNNTRQSNNVLTAEPPLADESQEAPPSYEEVVTDRDKYVRS